MMIVTQVLIMCAYLLMSYGYYRENSNGLSQNLAKKDHYKPKGVGSITLHVDYDHMRRK
jgi:hypothetical protein